MTSLLLAAVLAGCGGEAEELLRPKPTGCYLGSGEDRLHLSAEQTSNAATIAAVGLRDGMNERAVAVAIATAMQESELSNVDYGDHDSLGLFQQRPSVGWGTEEEILDPVYASFKFYEKLQRIDGWEDMELGEAAQAVQVSAYPDAYDQWEDDALIVAAVFAGGRESGVACVGGDRADEVSADSAALAEAFAYEWGTEASAVDGSAVALDGGDAVAGWNRAAWAVAKSYEYEIATVEYGGVAWVLGENEWVVPESEEGEAEAAADSADGSTVQVTLAAPE